MTKFFPLFTLVWANVAAEIDSNDRRKIVLRVYTITYTIIFKEKL